MGRRVLGIGDGRNEQGASAAHQNNVQSAHGCTASPVYIGFAARKIEVGTHELGSLLVLAFPAVRSRSREPGRTRPFWRAVSWTERRRSPGPGWALPVAHRSQGRASTRALESKIATAGWRRTRKAASTLAFETLEINRSRNGARRAKAAASTRALEGGLVAFLARRSRGRAKPLSGSRPDAAPL